MKAKEYDEAINMYSRAISLASDEAAAYSNRALAYLKVKNYAKCIEDADMAISLEPDYIKAYYRRAKAYLALNQVEAALADFEFLRGKTQNEENINNCI